MHARLAIGLILLLGAAVAAAEPPRRNSPAQKPANAVTAPGKASPAPLKLSIGDVRKYMMPHEFAAMVRAPDADRNTVVVEGERVLLPAKFDQPVPPGIIAPFWAIAHPTSAWRIFVPDPKAPPPGPAEVVPPPVFRRGP
jgi:hypothetical protein